MTFQIVCIHLFFYLFIWGFLFICLFGVLRRFQHCTGHITTGSWKGRGNQYIEFARVLYCKLPTNCKQLPAFPLETVRGLNPGLRGGKRECYHSATVAPRYVLKSMFYKARYNPHMFLRWFTDKYENWWICHRVGGVVNGLYLPAVAGLWGCSIAANICRKPCSWLWKSMTRYSLHRFQDGFRTCSPCTRYIPIWLSNCFKDSSDRFAIVSQSIRLVYKPLKVTRISLRSL